MLVILYHWNLAVILLMNEWKLHCFTPWRYFLNQIIKPHRSATPLTIDQHKACYYYVKISRVVTDTPKRKCPAQLILILRHDLLLNVQCPFQCLLLHSRKAFILFIYIFSIYLFIEINIFRLASMLTPQYITQRMVFPGFSLTQCVDWSIC